MTDHDECRTELVWDRDRVGTAESPCGETLEVGESCPWTPGRLLSLAAQSSLMLEFLRLAEQDSLPVLGYVSSGEAMFQAPPGEPAAVVFSPCVVVATEHDSARAEKLLEEAMEASPVCRLLRGGAELDARFVVALRVPA